MDGFNVGGSETCYSNASGSVWYGYDDLERLVEFDCGSGNRGQEFSYDQYDNLSKAQFPSYRDQLEPWLLRNHEPLQQPVHLRLKWRCKDKSAIVASGSCSSFSRAWNRSTVRLRALRTFRIAPLLWTSEIGLRLMSGHRTT